MAKDELAKIMYSVFASKGYEATSLNDLTSATQTKPATLYQAFENKEGMYIAALNHYKTTWLAELERTLQDDSLSLREKMKRFLRDAFTVFTCDGKPAGCLLVFSALAFPPSRASLGETLFDERRAFRDWLIGEAEKAASPCHLTPAEFADFIITLESGLALLALDNADQPTINSMIDKVIDSVCRE